MILFGFRVASGSAVYLVSAGPSGPPSVRGLRRACAQGLSCHGGGEVSPLFGFRQRIRAAVRSRAGTFAGSQMFALPRREGSAPLLSVIPAAAASRDPITLATAARWPATGTSRPIPDCFQQSSVLFRRCTQAQPLMSSARASRTRQWIPARSRGRDDGGEGTAPTPDRAGVRIPLRGRTSLARKRGAVRERTRSRRRRGDKQSQI